MCEYIVEEESLHGNFFDLKKKCKNMRKNAKNANKMQEKCKKNANPKKNAKKMQKKQTTRKMQNKCKKKNKSQKKMQKKCDKNAKKCKKMRKKCDPTRAAKTKSKKKENKGKKKGLTTEPPAGTSKNCSTPISKAKFVLKQKKSLSKNFPLAIFSL